MNTSSYKVLKLLNGEELVCELGKNIVDDSYEITHPLKMQGESKETSKGSVDSLNLSRWIGPYTEQSFFHIKTSHVLLVADASEGLSRYYEHVITEINRLDHPEQRKLLDDIDDEDVYDDLLSEMETDKTIH